MKAHVWRYLENRENYRGYHLTADDAGCVALLSWLSQATKRQVFLLHSVTPEVLSVPNNRGGSPAHFDFESLDLMVRPAVDSFPLAFFEASRKLTLECSAPQLNAILKGIEDVKRGHGDYIIAGNKEHRMWFWWYL